MSVKETIVFFEDKPTSKKNKPAMKVLIPAVCQLIKIKEEDATFGHIQKTANANQNQRWELKYENEKVILDLGEHNTLDVSELENKDVYFVIDTDGLEPERVSNWIRSPQKITSHPPHLSWLNRMANSEQNTPLDVNVLFLHPNLEGLEYSNLSSVNGSLPWSTISTKLEDKHVNNRYQGGRHRFLGIAWISSKYVQLKDHGGFFSELSMNEHYQQGEISNQLMRFPYSNSSQLMTFIKKFSKPLPRKCRSTDEWPIGALYLKKGIPNEFVDVHKSPTFPDPISKHLVWKKFTWGGVRGNSNLRQFNSRYH